MDILHMVKTTIEVDDDLDRRFRQTVATSKGFHKGALSKALGEALELWISQEVAKNLEKEKKKK